jgi:hypothetical protein
MKKSVVCCSHLVTVPSINAWNSSSPVLNWRALSNLPRSMPVQIWPSTATVCRYSHARFVGFDSEQAGVYDSLVGFPEPQIGNVPGDSEFACGRGVG